MSTDPVNAAGPNCCSMQEEKTIRSSREGVVTDVETTTCPVMVGTPVVKAHAEEAGLFRDYEGTRYYFCCAGCGPAFDADPERYAKAA